MCFTFTNMTCNTPGNEEKVREKKNWENLIFAYIKGTETWKMKICVHKKPNYHIMLNSKHIVEERKKTLTQAYSASKFFLFVSCNRISFSFSFFFFWFLPLNVILTLDLYFFYFHFWFETKIAICYRAAHFPWIFICECIAIFFILPGFSPFLLLMLRYFG